MNIAQSLDNLKLEQDAVVLYDALASIESDPRRAAAFRHIAENERRHADIWATRLRELDAVVPPVTRPRVRVRFIIVAARLLGTRAVSELVLALEGDEEAAYERQQEVHPEIAAIAADEREHAAIWKRLGDDPATDGTRRRGSGGRTVQATAVVAAAAHPPITRGVAESPEAITRGEGWHRSARSGTLRAVIFGVSDGLVSNLALVMGVAGASDDGHLILFTGIAGLLAGAFSMAAGEYISMQSQRELFERQIALERAELEAMPAEEQQELANLYMAKGFPRAEAERVAARIFENPEHALDTLVREELGLDPDELGSPWGAAFGSFLAFAVGASIPVLPYLFGGGTAVFVVKPGAEPRRPVRRRRGRQPPDGAEHAVQRLPAARDRRCGGGRDLRRGDDHRRGRHGVGSGMGMVVRTSRHASGRRASTRARGRTAGRPVCRPRARLRQGARVHGRVDPVRPAGDRRERRAGPGRPPGAAGRDRARRVGRTRWRDLPRGAPAGGPHHGAPAARRGQPVAGRLPIPRELRTPRRVPGRWWVRLSCAPIGDRASPRGADSPGPPGNLERSVSPALITMLTIENSTRSANAAMTTIVGTLRYGSRRGPGGLAG